MKKYGKPALLVFVGLVLIRGFAGGGINLTSSLFLPSVSQSLGIGVGTLSIYFSIMSLVAIFWLPFAGKLLARWNVRTLTVAASALQGLSFAAFGLMNHVIGFYILSVPHAMGTGILVSLLGPILIGRWFPHNTGIMLGILSAISGLFGAVLQPVTSGIIVSAGWRSGYGILGLVSFLVAAVSALLLRSQPGTEQAQQTEKTVPTGIPEKEAVRSSVFLGLLIFMTAITGVAVFVQHIPTYGDLLGYSLQQVGLVMSLSALGNAVGAVGAGYISDRVGSLRACIGLLVIWLLAVVGFLLSGMGFWMFALAVLLNGIAVSGSNVLVPLLTLRFFGKRDYTRLYAKVCMGAPLASIVLIPAYGYVYDVTQRYFPVLLVLLALLAVAAGAILLAWRQRPQPMGDSR